MSSKREIIERVRTRAKERCEYCLMHEWLQGATFHLEHIVPESHGGTKTLENLAWACPSCNLRKSDRSEGTDPTTGLTAVLYNPRWEQWSNHFRFET